MLFHITHRLQQITFFSLRFKLHIHNHDRRTCWFDGTLPRMCGDILHIYCGISHRVSMPQNNCSQCSMLPGPTLRCIPLILEAIQMTRLHVAWLHLLGQGSNTKQRDIFSPMDVSSLFTAFNARHYINHIKPHSTRGLPDYPMYSNQCCQVSPGNARLNSLGKQANMVMSCTLQHILCRILQFLCSHM